MSTLTRAEAQEHLEAGRQVVHEGRFLRAPADLPEHAKGQTFQQARHTNGTLTRAGMEATIREGAGVMHQGEVITRIENLPSEAALAGSDAKRLRALLEANEEQMAKLQTDRQQLLARLRQAESEAGAEETKKSRGRAAPKKDEEARKEEAPGDGLDEMHVDELLAKAEAENIDLQGATKKAEIVAAIRSGKKAAE